MITKVVAMIIVSMIDIIVGVTHVLTTLIEVVSGSWGGESSTNRCVRKMVSNAS